MNFDILELIFVKLAILSSAWGLGSVVYFMSTGASPTKINLLIALGPMVIFVGIPIILAIIYFLLFVWSV